jgi:hypothetical protein
MPVRIQTRLCIHLLRTNSSYRTCPMAMARPSCVQASTHGLQPGMQLRVRQGRHTHRVISTSSTTHHPRHPIPSHTIPYYPLPSHVPRIPATVDTSQYLGIFWERQLTFCIDFHHNPQMGNPSGVCIPCIHFDRLAG